MIMFLIVPTKLKISYEAQIYFDALLSTEF
jgi:hypothetical protein